MNLENMLETTLEEKRRRAILHEFGHALVVVHEQASPLANISWNKDVVYSEVAERNGWDKDRIDSNFFKVYTTADVTATAFDLSSIMLYSFP